MNTIKTSPLAICSLVLGIVSVVLFLGPLAGIPAIICGHVSRANIRKSGGTLTGKHIALAGLTLGYFMTAYVFVISQLWQHPFFKF